MMMPDVFVYSYWYTSTLMDCVKTRENIIVPLCCFVVIGGEYILARIARPGSHL